MLWGQKSTWGHLGSLGSNLVLCYIVFTCYSYIYAYALASTPLLIREHLAHLSDKGLQVKQKKMAPAGVVLFEHSMSSSNFFFSLLVHQKAFVSYVFLTFLPCRRPAGSCILHVSFLYSFFFLLLLLLLSSFWQHIFFTYFPTSDFDLTWLK